MLPWGFDPSPYQHEPESRALFLKNTTHIISDYCYTIAKVILFSCKKALMQKDRYAPPTSLTVMSSVEATPNCDNASESVNGLPPQYTTKSLWSRPSAPAIKSYNKVLKIQVINSVILQAPKWIIYNYELSTVSSTLISATVAFSLTSTVCSSWQRTNSCMVI